MSQVGFAPCAVAFVGKGGVGKSSLAGTFARVLARTGERVLALDSDPMPGLAFSLGVERVDDGLPGEAVQEYDDDGRRRYRLRDGLTGTGAVEAYAVRGPDGVRFLQLGKASGPRWNNSRQHFGFQHVLDDLPGDGWSIVGDLPGGTRQPFMTWGRYADTFLVVVEPTSASMLTGRRLARLAATGRAPNVVAVVNKVREPSDIERVGRRTGLPVVGSVPYDPEVAIADRLGRAVLDHDPEGATAKAVRSLVDALRFEMEPR
ncbi:MAG: ArsA-related P-loop ATPase [Nocardioidaceae bacterium]